MARSVVVVGFPGVQPLDVTGPFDVFSSANFTVAATGGEKPYEPRLATVGGGRVATGTGLDFASDPLPDPAEPIDTLILPGGLGIFDTRDNQNDDLVDWIRRTAPTVRRVVSVCSGAFLAARAGLLDGCRATTHWAAASLLAERFPDVTVDPDPIFLRSSEQVWTAAGVTSGIDLSLTLVEEDCGVDVAQQVARWLVLYMRRPGGQTQFAPPVWMPRARRQPIRAAQEAIEARPGEAHTVDNLAEAASMSPRNFTRVFTGEVGESPGAYVERVRTDAARRLLEQTDDTMPVIAQHCGFGTAETLRRVFIRRLGVSPVHYRKTFQ
ncbi:putative AraC family transcriptional regulator [Gordonia araii NBRC 100433]|uniref:Putative AraC family transcriptional regulator n=1 Tax=Gordonia araii NBRC 100433 TaxID=1073574 RepID=G7GZK6_9ACTN|nr:GlxA family transcriptional regulator [Gordonia araii]NNG97900.1 GlxA family transcriptional regulator [Gordonia araii NBRC 100433]GAB09031.1 putative AraC family transcriptional regulator [Gordonia araii NBRC 100433]